MKDDNTKPLSRVIRIDEGEIRGHLDELVRGTVEETLNGLLDAEADEMCRAQRYERSSDRIDTRAGHYTRKLSTKAGEVKIRMPNSRHKGAIFSPSRSLAIKRSLSSIGLHSFQGIRDLPQMP